MLAVVAALLLQGCGGDDGGDSGGNSLTPVTLRLDFGLVAYHAPFFFAQSRGYYEDEGLKLKIDGGTGSGDAVKLVASGDATFGLASLTTVTKAVAESNVPVKAVAGWIPKLPDGFISLAEAGIKEPKDLERTTGGLDPSGSGGNLLNAFVAKEGLDAKTITQESVASNAKQAMLRAGKVDWVINFGFTQSPSLNAEGLDHNVIPIGDYLEILGHGLISSTDTVESKPEIVQKFVTATLRGLEEALANPEDAAAAMVKANPELEGQEAILAEGLVGMKDYVHTKNSLSSPLGWTAPEDWAGTTAFVHDYLGAPEVDPKSLYTNEFVDH